ncbi:MAG: hypothetical protein V7641_1614 [Blastocatellia bacterium]
MAKSTNVIRIPKAPADAFNQHRPVSDLLWTQVEHLAAVVRREIDEERRAIRTEGQASAFIKKYTAFLHPQGASKKPAPSSRGAKQTSSSKSAKKKPTRSSKG